MADDPNGRVTLAVLQNEIAHVRQDIADVRRDISELKSEWKFMSTHVVAIGNDAIARSSTNEKRIDVLSSLVETIARSVEKLSTTATENATHRVAMTERWIAHKEEHARENKNQATFAAVLSTFTSTIAGIVAALVGGKP
jgi:septal ring factor EnvC (AmiA/AmiB activator)